MKKLLLVSFFYSIPMYGMGPMDPETLLVVSHCIRRKVNPQTPTTTQSRQAISMDVLEPIKPKSANKNYQSTTDNESSKQKEELPNWQNFLLFLCCIPGR